MRAACCPTSVRELRITWTWALSHHLWVATRLAGASSAGRRVTAWTSAARPEFEAFVEQRGQEFLETVDKWLTEHQAGPATGAARKRVRLGLGVFLIAGE